MESKKLRNIELIIGTFLMAIAYKCIYDSVHMVTGGFSGIGVIVRHVTMGLIDGGIPMWVTNIVLNIPLFIASYIIMGRKFVLQTLTGTILLTVFLGVLPTPYIDNVDYFLVAIAGGLIYGCGIGCVLSSGATTGGTDMLAVLISKFVGRHSVVRIMQYLDGAVIIAGVIVFGIRVSLYAMIAIYIGTIISDRIVEGAKSAKAVWIISDKYAEISNEVISRLQRGATAFDATGMYYNRRKAVLLCIVSKKQIAEIKRIVFKYDENAFLVIGDVREVCGEGFVQNLH